jgi:hypothetical protein
VLRIFVIARLDRAIHMWTAPSLQEWQHRRSKRLRSYVRPVEAVALTAAKMGTATRVPNSKAVS